MTNIILRKLSFSYPGHDVFADLDLLIDTRWRTGLVGRNGRGKTTLLRLLNEQLLPVSGTIEQCPPTYYFPFLPANPEHTAFDVIKDAAGPYRSLERSMEAALDDGSDRALANYGELQTEFQARDGYAIEGRIHQELDALKVTVSMRTQTFSTLSPGEQTRCLLAALFAQQDKLALIDEPTNHLDLVGRALVADYLSTKDGFVLVSHDRAFLDAAVDHIVALNPDDIEVQQSDYSTWRAGYDSALAGREARNTVLKKQIQHLIVAARQRRSGADQREADKGPHMDKGFVGHRAAKQMKRALNIERRADADVQARKALLTNREKSYDLKFPPATGHRSRALLVANNLHYSLPDGRQLLDNVSLTISVGDRIAIIGANGAGKSTLLDLLCQARSPASGELSIANYITVNRTHQEPVWQRPLDEELKFRGLSDGRFRQVMAALGVRGDVLDQHPTKLSAGQRKKLDLAASFLTPSDLIIWDEPLNFVDMETREAIGDAILRDSPTMVFVEHDRRFVEDVATQIIEL